MTKPTIMKVVDSNVLQCVHLNEYLAQSPTNFAVLTDYAAVEAYKAETLDMLYRSMRILSQFPKQVVILKSTPILCGLYGRRAGLQRRLIDQRQTTRFAKFCAQLAEAQRGKRSVEIPLLDHARGARLEMERLLPDADEFRAGIEKLATEFTEHEKKILAGGHQPFTERMRVKIQGDVIANAILMLRQHHRVSKMPKREELPNTFIFRYFLCRYIYAITLLIPGRVQVKKSDKLRNELVDMVFVACATYFDEGSSRWFR